MYIYLSVYLCLPGCVCIIPWRCMYLYLAVYVCLTCDGCIFILRGMYVYLRCMYVCLPGDVCRQQNPTASMCRPVYQRVTSVISVETSLLCKRIREAWTDAHCYTNNYSNINHRPHCSTEELFQSMNTLLTRETVPINEHIAHPRNSSNQWTQPEKLWLYWLREKLSGPNL